MGERGFKLKKTFITLATVGVVGFGSATLGSTVHADSLEDIQDQRSDIKDSLSDADAKIADVLIDLEKLNDQISRVEDTLKANKAQVKETEEKIGEKNNQIDKLEDEITDLEKSIEERYDVLKERAVSYQKNGGDVGYMEVVLGSSNFNEFVSRVSAVSKITDSDEELMLKQEEDKKEVEKKQSNAEDKLAELKDMEGELKSIQDTIVVQKEEKEDSKQDLKKKESKLNEMKDDLKIEDSELASLEADVKESIEAARQEREEQLTASNADVSDESNESTETNEANEPSNSNDSNDSADSNNTNNNNSDNANDASESNHSSDAKKSTSKDEVVQLSDSNSGGNGSVTDVGKQFIGNSTYVFGAKNPSAGQFDCSGFVSWAYEQEGTSLPRSTSGLSSVGSKVSASDMQVGDLVFFDTYKTNGHVGIYMGNGQFIGSQSSTGVAIANMTSGYWKDHFSGHVRRVN